MLWINDVSGLEMPLQGIYEIQKFSIKANDAVLYVLSLYLIIPNSARKRKAREANRTQPPMTQAGYGQAYEAEPKRKFWQRKRY